MLKTSVFEMGSNGLPPQVSQVEIYRTLLEHIRLHKEEGVSQFLGILQNSDTKRNVLHGIDTDGETLLHTAVKLKCSTAIVECIIEACPELLTACREESFPYRGQTGLHIAVTGGNYALVECLLESAENQGQSILSELLKRRASGSRFENTVMMGETPLIVAALTLNIRMVDILLMKGAYIGDRNSEGDNVMHCLIKYAFLYPEKIESILAMCDHVALAVNGSVNSLTYPFDLCSNFDDDKEKLKYDIWFSRNNSHLNPLQLSAKLGQQKLFKLIIEMRGVYSYVNSEDGLFDVELYDVTDIDTLYQQRQSKIGHDDSINDHTTATSSTINESVSEVPTLEIIFNSGPEVVFKFIEMTPLRYAINRKWLFYRWFYRIWGCLHMLFMIGFTVYAIRRSEFKTGDGDSKRYAIWKDPFETFYLILSLVVAAVYLAQEIIRVMKRQMPWSKYHLMNCYHNGPFRLMLLLFSITVLADSAWAMFDRECRDYILVCAMILGWWFIVFFLRCIRQFSFFTVMIQKVLVGDMFRFSIIISMELIAFTSGLFIVFRGSVTGDENVYSFGKLMVLMFKMMFGFTSIDVLFEAREPWFAVCIYVAFVILTYVLMVNSLIAMMSNTCSVVSKDRDMQFRVQQLSIILFFESVYPRRFKKLIGSPKLCNWYDPTVQRFTRRNRYFMEVKSLHEVTKSKSRLRPKPETMLETIFHTIQQINLPSIFDYADSPVAIGRETAERSSPIVDLRTEYSHSATSRRPKRKKKKRRSERSANEYGDASA